jgi:putative pyruvate formate lyase activating enzyme
MASSAGDFVIEDFTPAYLAPEVYRGLSGRVAAAIESLRCCRACPRRCEVDRLSERVGFCRTGRHAAVCSAFAHTGEERCLVGRHGSGTVFFGRCNLHCVFCQNWDISQEESGTPCEADSLADVMLALQEKGCHNINFVTPEHVVPQAIEALAIAAERGLELPVVYNTSGYDSMESLRLLDGLADIYMPDFKLWSPDLCAEYLNAKDYAEHARQAITEMHRQVGDLTFTPDGVACRGLLVRYLVMPGLPDESRQILEWLAREVSPDTFVNIMGQYRPEHLVGRMSEDPNAAGGVRYPKINRRPTREEIESAYEAARKAGLWRFD